jgi:hypothetical protein
MAVRAVFVTLAVAIAAVGDKVIDALGQAVDVLL